MFRDYFVQFVFYKFKPKVSLKINSKVCTVLTAICWSPWQRIWNELKLSSSLVEISVSPEFNCYFISIIFFLLSILRYQCSRIFFLLFMFSSPSPGLGFHLFFFFYSHRTQTHFPVRWTLVFKQLILRLSFNFT